MRNPVGAVETIYAAFADGQLAPDAKRAMTAYVAAHPKDGLGVHGYDLGEFGLDRAQLTARFADYIARYDVPREPSAR
jgi:hypothetical protein